MSCPTKTYPLSPSEAVSICGKIHVESGIYIDPSQSTGMTTTHGVMLSWSIHDDQIDIAITSKPWIISCETITNQLDKLFIAT